MSASKKTDGMAMAHARKAWGETLPDYIFALARVVDVTSYQKCARAVGYSGAALSLVLKRKYTGDYSAIEQAVTGALMKHEVTCPVDGVIRADRCSVNQRSKMSTTNPRAIRLWRACRSGCPNSRIGDK